MTDGSSDLIYFSVINETGSYNTTTSFLDLGEQDVSLQLLEYADQVSRVISICLFVIYFILVCIVRDLRNKNLFYLHHSNFVGFLFCLMCLVYFNNRHYEWSTWPMFDNLFCSISEFGWSILKYLRPYSVLTIAFYRFAAVYSNNTFRRINGSKFYLFLPVLFVWAVSLVLVLVTKLIFHTTHGSELCLDGYQGHQLAYLFTTCLLALFIPFVLILVIFVCIRYKLKQIALKSRSSNQTIALLVFNITNPAVLNSTTNSASGSTTVAPSAPAVRKKSTIGFNIGGSSSSPMNRYMKKYKELSKSKRFDKKLLVNNLCDFACISLSFLLSLEPVLSDEGLINSRYLDHFKIIVRILSVMSQSMISLVSVSLSPKINSDLGLLLTGCGGCYAKSNSSTDLSRPSATQRQRNSLNNLYNVNQSL